MDFKDRLRLLRTERGLTQEEFGKTFKVIKQTVSSWEKGNSKPDLDMLKAIADFFNVSIDYLLGYSPSSSSTIPEIKTAKREILQLEDLLESDNLTFKGAPLSEGDREKIKHALELAFWDAKDKNRRR